MSSIVVQPTPEVVWEHCPMLTVCRRQEAKGVPGNRGLFILQATAVGNQTFHLQNLV